LSQNFRTDIAPRCPRIAYGAGQRVSEVANLKVSDIDELFARQ
jgi:integrase